MTLNYGFPCSPTRKYLGISLSPFLLAFRAEWPSSSKVSKEQASKALLMRLPFLSSKPRPGGPRRLSWHRESQSLTRPIWGKGIWVNTSSFASFYWSWYRTPAILEGVPCKKDTIWPSPESSLEVVESSSLLDLHRAAHFILGFCEPEICPPRNTPAPGPRGNGKLTTKLGYRNNELPKRLKGQKSALLWASHTCPGGSRALGLCAPM